MPEKGPNNAEKLHDAVVQKAAETIFRKYKVVMNIAGRKVASVDDIYPDILAYEVFSVKPFLASDSPALIGIVETEDATTQQLLDKWGRLRDLAVDKIVLILPDTVKEYVDALQRTLGSKFEFHFFDRELHIS